jgi:hypothetical protein
MGWYFLSILIPLKFAVSYLPSLLDASFLVFFSRCRSFIFFIELCGAINLDNGKTSHAENDDALGGIAIMRIIVA